MNNVTLIGRLTADPQLYHTTGANPTAICAFTIAINQMTKPGEEEKADFPRIKVFGKQAENVERFLCKGRLVGVTGRIETGSYTDKNGNKVYTTEIVASNVEFLERSKAEAQANARDEERQAKTRKDLEDVESEFAAIEEEIPF